ncbi:MAG: ABC transporter substrate-binding protein [Coriobacteriia bacterium]|nr:ABC transporter substrate-binding protein [Coriobacteriia bacterium]
MTRIARSTRTRRARLGMAALALAAVAALATGCGAPAEEALQPVAETPVSTTYPLTITDDANRTVTIKVEPQRIVSLAPANTEMLFAVGAGDRVVGVTSYDDYPAEVADIAKVGDFAGPNLEAIAGADPDLILATTGVQADVITQLEELGATVIAIDPQSLDGVYEVISEVAAAVNEVEAGEGVVAQMRLEAQKVADAVAGKETASTFVEIAQNPLFTTGSGTLLDELVTLAGGDNVVDEAGWVPYSPEKVVKSDPSVYLATKGSMSDPAELEKRPGFAELQAVKAGRVYVLDDNLVSRPGPRIMLGLRQIAEAIHPEAFQ